MASENNNLIYLDSASILLPTFEHQKNRGVDYSQLMQNLGSLAADIVLLPTQGDINTKLDAIASHRRKWRHDNDPDTTHRSVWIDSKILLPHEFTTKTRNIFSEYNFGTLKPDTQYGLGPADISEITSFFNDDDVSNIRYGRESLTKSHTVEACVSQAKALIERYGACLFLLDLINSRDGNASFQRFNELKINLTEKFAAYFPSNNLSFENRTEQGFEYGIGDGTWAGINDSDVIPLVSDYISTNYPDLKVQYGIAIDGYDRVGMRTVR